MTNKREIKKYIHRVGVEIAQNILPSAVLTNMITEEEAENVLTEMSKLEAQALSRVAIVFDKAPKSFEAPGEYKKARAKYYKTAYAKLIKEFEAGINAILAQLKKAKA